MWQDWVLDFQTDQAGRFVFYKEDANADLVGMSSKLATLNLDFASSGVRNFENTFGDVDFNMSHGHSFKNRKEWPEDIMEQLKGPAVSFDVEKLLDPFNNLDVYFSFFKILFTHNVKDGQIEPGSDKSKVITKIVDAKLKRITILISDAVKEILGADYLPDILRGMRMRGFRPRHLLVILLGFKTKTGEEVNLEMNFDHFNILEQALANKDKLINVVNKNVNALKINFVFKSGKRDKLFLPGEVKYDSSTSKMIFRNEGEQDYNQNSSAVMQKVEVIRLSVGYFDVLKNLMTVNKLRDFLDRNRDAILKLAKQ